MDAQGRAEASAEAVGLCVSGSRIASVIVLSISVSARFISIDTRLPQDHARSSAASSFYWAPTSSLSACRQTQSLATRADVTSFSQSLEGLVAAANCNAKSVEESAAYCNDLEESFAHLKGRLEKILGSA